MWTRTVLRQSVGTASRRCNSGRRRALLIRALNAQRRMSYTGWGRSSGALLAKKESSNNVPDFFNTNPPPDTPGERTKMDTKAVNFDLSRLYQTSGSSSKKKELSDLEEAIFGSGKESTPTTPTKSKSAETAESLKKSFTEAFFGIVSKAESGIRTSPYVLRKVEKKEGEKDESQKQSKRRTRGAVGDENEEDDDDESFGDPFVANDVKIDAAENVNAMQQILNGKKSKSLVGLKYWNLYPMQVKKWVMFLHSTRGYYDMSGEWVTVQNEDPRESFYDQAELQNWENLYQKEQKELPHDLQGHFRFGVQWDEIKLLHPKIRRLFSYKFATQKEILKHRKSLAIQKWRLHPFDTASDAVQIDILTQRIRALNGHLAKNKQDKANFRAREKLIKRRKGLLQHLKRRDVHTYFCVLREIKLRDTVQVYNFNAF